jgi:hypothetical protein
MVQSLEKGVKFRWQADYGLAHVGLPSRLLAEAALVLNIPS